MIFENQRKKYRFVRFEDIDRRRPDFLKVPVNERYAFNKKYQDLFSDLTYEKIAEVKFEEACE